MSFPDLRAFIDCLRQAGDLAQIDTPVDPYLEAAEVHRRVVAAGGPALLFTNVRGPIFRSSRTSSARPTAPSWPSVSDRNA